MVSIKMIKQKDYEKQQHEKYLEKLREYKKKWYWDNPERARELTSQYRINNPEKMEQWRKNNPEYRKQWFKDNPEYKKNWMKNRNKTDLKFNLNQKMSRVISLSLKGNKNGRHWESLVGYTLNVLINYLNKTIPEGFKWQDYIDGKLVVDHIIPRRAFIFRKPEDEEFRQCWSLYNLRLLTKKENSKKNDSINNPILLGLLLNLNN